VAGCRPFAAATPQIEIGQPKPGGQMPINAIPTATVCTSIERATDRHRAIIHLSMRESPLNVFARRRIVNVLFRFAVLFSLFITGELAPVSLLANQTAVGTQVRFELAMELDTPSKTSENKMQLEGLVSL
jgi:hypothetical protein